MKRFQQEIAAPVLSLSKGAMTRKQRVKVGRFKVGDFNYFINY
jgi:hypothetical protein